MADLQPSRPPQNFPSEGADNNNRPSQARRNYRAASSLPPSPSNANKQTSPPVEALSSNIAPQHATVLHRASPAPSAQRERGFGPPEHHRPRRTTRRARGNAEGSTSKGGGASLLEADGGDGIHLPPTPKYRGQQMMRSAEDLCPSSENGQALSDRENRSSGESGMPPPRGAGGDRVKGNERAPPTK